MSKRSAATPLTVRLTPLSAIEPFLGHETRKPGREDERHGEGVPHASKRRKPADAVDVPGDEVTAKTVASSERPLQVDVGPYVEGAQSGPCQRLGRRIDGETVGQDLDDGQADAVDRNRLPEGQRVGACPVRSRQGTLVP